MNTPNPERWSDLDLELYHDGELTGPARTELSESLRESPELRARLSRIARLDALTSRALAGAPSAPLPISRAVVRTVGGIGLAACLALLFVPFLARRPGAAPTPPVPTPRTEVAVAPPPAARIVLTLPVIKRAASAEPRSGDASSRADSSDGDRLAALPSDASAPERDAQFRRLGEIIRSAARAEELLDALPAHEQLAACRVWADDPRLRPFAFARLDRLRSRDELSDQYRAVLTGFSSRPELSPWVRSYLRAAPSDRAPLKSS